MCNNHIPSSQPNTGISDGRSHHSMLLVHQTNEQHAPQCHFKFRPAHIVRASLQTLKIYNEKEYNENV